MNPFLCFYFLLCLSFSSFYLVKNQLTPPPPPPLPQVSGFHLAQQWPASYCNLHSRYCKRAELLKNVNFTIHGLWPFDSSENSLQGCKSFGSKFKNSYVSAIQGDLAKAWQSFDTRKSDVQFWKHEWDKHGRCSENVLVGADYFKTTLDLKNTFNILDILAKARIKPDDKYYDVPRIRNAIHLATGVYPKVICKNKKLLSEINLCIDQSATTFVTCSNQWSSCTQKNTVMFISIASAARTEGTTGMLLGVYEYIYELLAKAISSLS